MRRLLKSVGQGHSSDSDVLSVLIGNLLEGSGHLDLRLGLLVAEDIAETLAILLALLHCGLGLELASTESVLVIFSAMCIWSCAVRRTQGATAILMDCQ